MTMTATEIVSQIVEILTTGLIEFGTGIGAGISNAVGAMWFTTGTEGAQQMSIYAILILAFAAVGLCVGLTTLIFNWLGSLGN